MNYVSSLISLTAWSGVTAGAGAAIFLPNVSFMRAAVIGGGSVTAAGAAIGIALIIAQTVSKDLMNARPGAFEGFLKNWTWVAIIPLVAIPYAGGVSRLTGIALIAFGFAGAALKGFTVGILPDK